MKPKMVSHFLVFYWLDMTTGNIEINAFMRLSDAQEFKTLCDKRYIATKRISVPYAEAKRRGVV